MSNWCVMGVCGECAWVGGGMFFPADNWARELEKWCPSLKVLVYYGKLRLLSRICNWSCF